MVSFQISSYHYSLTPGLNRNTKSSAHTGKKTFNDIFYLLTLFLSDYPPGSMNSFSWFSKGLKELIEKKYNIAFFYWENLGQ